MQISIKDHGPLKEKVTIATGGESVTFAMGSFHKLESLLVLLGASPDGIPTNGESHWTLDSQQSHSVDPVREHALMIELDHAREANAKLSAELSASIRRIGELIEENNRLWDIIHKKRWWDRLQWPFNKTL